MHYACSDLHGFSLERFKAMLEEVGFCSGDTLWVLGDTIDRGSHGIALLQWFMSQPNVHYILGNHESMMLSCSFLFEDMPFDLSPGQMEAYMLWLSNGAKPTLDALDKLNNCKIRLILKYLRNAPLYEEIEINSRRLILTHSGLGDFSQEKKLCEYTPEQLLWHRPELTDEYYDDAIVIFGHTPTMYYSDEYAGCVLSGRTWIDIDVGACAGMTPALLRLDDLKAFYFQRTDGRLSQF